MLGRQIALVVVLAAVLAGCLSGNLLHESIRLGVGRLLPLPADQLANVRTTAGAAAKAVLDNKRQTAWPARAPGGEDGGCFLLPLYDPQPMSSPPDRGPPYPVYMVRLVDPTGAAGVSWVLVDARSGDI